jgi:hypothetical protein
LFSNFGLGLKETAQESAVSKDLWSARDVPGIIPSAKSTEWCWAWDQPLVAMKPCGYNRTMQPAWPSTSDQISPAFIPKKVKMRKEKIISKLEITKLEF